MSWRQDLWVGDLRRAIEGVTDDSPLTVTVVDSSGEARWADGLHVEVAGNPWDCMPHAFLDVRVDGTVLWDRPGL
ncbi:MAG: hypothetical protein IKG18_03525 [Atopobiaceae bacterium]|nr:hypothetical protein [Atopobiaceae bacterium]